MRAVIFDDNPDRQAGLAASLPESFEIIKYDKVTDDSNKFIEPADCRLILLHQRGPDPRSPCGNANSWRFFTNKLLPLIRERKAALIAYTGGSCPEPDEFRNHRDGDCKGWCIYLNGINDPRDIHLKEFGDAWENRPHFPPPLELLVSDSSPMLVKQLEDLFRLFLDTELFLLYRQRNLLPKKLKTLALPSDRMRPDWIRYFDTAAKLASEHGETENWPFLMFSDDVRDVAAGYRMRKGSDTFIADDPLIVPYEEQWKKLYS